MTRKNKTQPGSEFWPFARSFLHVYLPKVRNLSQNTIESYKQSLTYYIHYLETQMNIMRQDITFDSLSRKHIKDYLVWMHEIQNLTAKTCNLRLTALRSFMEYCAEKTLHWLPFTMTGKGNKSRNVPLMEKTVAHLLRYLQEFHPKSNTDGRDPLFYPPIR